MATIILGILVFLCLYFTSVLYRTIGFQITKSKKEVVAFMIGFIADFCDTLGIGSYMISMTGFKMSNLLEDERNLPGTLLVMHALPTLVEALFFITVVKVESMTLVSLVLAAVLGSLIGSRLIMKLDKRKIQLIAGVAMVLTSLLMLAKKLGWIDLIAASNEAMGLHGKALLIGTIGNFMLGVLMSAGIGLYAPCMVMVYLLGLNPLAAFPIMMVSCAALMPVSGIAFVRNGLFQKKYLWSMIIGGIIGVFIAAIFVKNLSLEALTWLIVGIGFLTAWSLFKGALKEE